MKHMTQHEIAWTLIEKGSGLGRDKVVAVYEDHSELRARLNKLDKHQPNKYTISSIYFYPKA
jgi:hypothetical protein